MQQANTNKIGIFYDFLIKEGFFNDSHLEQIRAAAPEAEIIVVKDSEKITDETLAKCADIEIFFGTDVKGWIKSFPDLKWVQVSIAGAGLDVFEKEPLEESSPFWELPNVIITPHVAGGTPYYVDRLVDIFCENIKRYYSGKPLINLVDRKSGY